MHGDFSRGHEPDRKRGRNYRRVLLQMGRPLLDSDVAASVDAALGEVQATTRGLGCAAGSPDLGFLVTPGRLLAVFAESSDGVRVMGGTPDVWVDYRFRYLDRYPALFVRAAGGIPARLTIPSLQPLEPGAAGRRVALWSARRAVRDDRAQRRGREPRAGLARRPDARRVRRAGVGPRPDRDRSARRRGGLAVPPRTGRGGHGRPGVLGRPRELPRRRPDRRRPRRRAVPRARLPDRRRLPLGRQPARRSTTDRARLPAWPGSREPARRLPRRPGAPRHGRRRPGHPRGGTRPRRHVHPRRVARTGQARGHQRIAVGRGDPRGVHPRRVLRRPS